jgi:hypothetical protein
MLSRKHAEIQRDREHLSKGVLGGEHREHSANLEPAFLEVLVSVSKSLEGQRGATQRPHDRLAAGGIAQPNTADREEYAPGAVAFGGGMADHGREDSQILASTHPTPSVDGPAQPVDEQDSTGNGAV